MDKFINHEGEQPIWLGDIDFMNESVRNAIKMLLQGITGLESPTCILQGCEITPSGVNAGVVCLNGEVLPVEASTENGIECHFEVEQSLGGERLTKENKPVSCYQYRKVIVVPGTGESSDIATMPRLGQYLRSDTYVASKENTTDSPGSYAVRVVNGRYVISGFLITYVEDTSVNQWNLVDTITLPAGPAAADRGGYAAMQMLDPQVRGEEIPMRVVCRQKNSQIIEIKIYRWGRLSESMTQYNYSIEL